MIRVQVVHVLVDKMNNPVVLLRDLENEMNLPIWVGEAEAIAIQREIEGVRLTRPMTHDLLCNILTELGVELVRVEISDLHDDTYYATLVLKWNGRTFFIDARPSDSIALALKMGVPIYVSEEVAHIAGHFPKPNRREIERFRRLMEGVEIPEM